MQKIVFGYALCGSFCTFEKAIEQMREIAGKGYEILPIMSDNAYATDTRFGKAADFIWEIEDICKNKIIHTIVGAEPIGPKRMVDAMLISPCTGNTLAKLAGGITVVINLATNDALGASAQNIGRLMNTKNIYFVPLRQDDPVKKPMSLVADFTQLLPTALNALEGRQLQPVLRGAAEK